MRKFLAGVVFTLLVLVGGLYLYLSRGAFPVGADTVPTKFERKFAHMAIEGHVERHASRQENPVQPTSANLMEGAMGYEEHCALCHGGAASRTSPLAKRFNPPVPQLINRVPHDDDWQLFWITKHGIRLTGMPGWDGLLSDDQMWKIIAFVKHSDKLPPEVQAAWQQAAQPQKQQTQQQPPATH